VDTNYSFSQRIPHTVQLKINETKPPINTIAISVWAPKLTSTKLLHIASPMRCRNCQTTHWRRPAKRIDEM